MSTMIFKHWRPSTTQTNMDPAHWLERVRALVKPKRLEHIERVAVLARQIAEANGTDGERAFLAGVLHDLARDFAPERLLELAQPENDLDRENPLALHGRAARTLLEAWGFDDTVVLDAVEDHVTGPRSPHPVSLAVYIADVSEPGRGVNHDIRDLAFIDLERAYAAAIYCKVKYLERCGKPVHPRTRQAFERVQNQVLDVPVCADLVD